MDPNQVKKEPVEEPIVLENLEKNAGNIAADKDLENNAGNIAADKDLENNAGNIAADKDLENDAGNIAADKKLSIDEAIAFTAWLRRGENDPTKAKDPIVLAKDNFISLAAKLNADLTNLSLEDRALREVEVFKAEEDYTEKLAEQKALAKEKRRKDLQERFAREPDESASYTAISKGKVWAKLKVGNTECAMVEVREMEGGECYQVFDASLVDQAQLTDAPKYDDLNKKISRAQAALAFAAGYRGGPETLLSTFEIEEFLEPKLPKKSSPDVVPRKSRTTIWMMGHLKEENGPDGKLVRSGLWMMPRSKWEGMRPSKDKRKIYSWGVGRAIRQFHNYQDSLEVEEKDFQPEKTPFDRAGSESAADWREPSTTPQPKGTPDRDISEEPPAQVIGGEQDQDMDM